MVYLFCFVLLSINSIISAEYVCPMKDPVTVGPTDSYYSRKPFVDGMKKFFGGVIDDWKGKETIVTSPIIDSSTGERSVIGKLASMGSTESLEVIEVAKKAWNNGQGDWPQMTASQRIHALESVLNDLKSRRDEIAEVLKWEICKSTSDSYAEFDRTMKFAEETIDMFKKMDASNVWKTISGIFHRVRRIAIGIMLCLGPFNYPFNETYATLIPALLAGNIAILKLPAIGGLAHILTMEAYAKHLPPGTINFLSGSGRETISPIMKSGIIDIFAFIGGSKAADAIIKDHPHPHRLNIFLQLEGKNLGVILPDADLETAANEVLIGSTSFNGQRCTAIKLVMVHESKAREFLDKFIPKITALKAGLPWEDDVAITPLPEGSKKIKYLNDLIEDAVLKGAKVVNAEEGGGEVRGNLMKPAIVYPVTEDMRLWHEEQFGPVIPIAKYSNIEEIYDYVNKTPFGQQAAIFTSNAEASASLLDTLAMAVGRVNINTQCGRSPDVVPFSGRRSSALGTMSISDAIREFSVEVVVAGKSSGKNDAIMRDYEAKSKFLQPIQ